MRPCKREKIAGQRCIAQGDAVGDYDAMHEKNFLSNWLGKDLVGKEERRKKEDKKIREEF